MQKIKLETQLTFSWRSRNIKECYIAICAAVRSGYCTREEIIEVLPQFSFNRLVLALDDLIASRMAQINFDQLTLSEDMIIVEALAAGRTIDLPIAADMLKSTGAMRDILGRLGLQNISGALELLRYEIKEIKHVD